MKTIRTTLAVAAIILSAGAVMGSGKVKVEMKANDSEITVVDISNSKMSEIEVDVKNEYGESFYSKKTNTPIDQFRTKYEFSNLEDGTYRFSVKIDTEKTVNTFKVEDGEVELIKSRKSVEPYFKYKDDILKITYLNFQEEDVKMYVYDGKNLLYEKALGAEFKILHGVDFSDLSYGDYEVVLANNEDIYEYEVSVR